MNMRNYIIAAIAGVLVSSAAHADDAHHNAAGPNTPAVSAEVRKVDRNANKVTLRHEPIPNLDMPAMTMVFHVKDAAMLDQMKAGDKINFVADKINGAYTVIKFETAK